MESLIEDEEFRFFDAQEEIASCSSSSSDRIYNDDSPSLISDSDSSIPGNFQYDVWIRGPGNAEERRSKFLNWMGVSTSQLHHENSCNVDLDSSRIRISENHSGAVLRNSVFDDKFSSCRSELSMGGLRDNADRMVKEHCEENILESCKAEFDVSGPRMRQNFSRVVLRNLDFDDEICSSLCSGSPASGFMDNLDRIVKENGELIETESPKLRIRDEASLKQQDLGGIMKRVKEKWLNRLKKVRNRQRSGDAEDNFGALGGRIERVKVKEYKRRVKELSALYKGQEIQAHEGPILSMKFSPDGQYLASAGEDGVLRIWNVVEDVRSDEHDVPKMDPSCMYFEVNNLSELRPVVAEKEKITSTLMSPRKTTDSACVIFPPKIFRVLERPVHEFIGHTGDILDISWSKNNHLLSASVDKTVRLWQVSIDNCLGVFSHSNYVTSVQFNPVDDDYFISGSIDGKVRIWSVSQCQVMDWADARGIVTAVCYRPDGQGGIVGTLTSDCRFYNVSDHHLQLDAHVCLHSKKKSSNKRITGFQFTPNVPNRVMVVSADSQVRILDGLNIVQKYKGSRNAGNQISASFTADGKHIISACDDSTIYVWNCIDQGIGVGRCNDPEPSSSSFSQTKRVKIRSFERFSADVSVAIPWCGFNSELSPSLFSLGHEFVLDSPKGSATWPEEKLGSSFSPAKAIRRSQNKFLRSSCQRTSESSHLWGLVIVTGGWDGRIRLFHNYGLPVPV